MVKESQDADAKAAKDADVKAAKVKYAYLENQGCFVVLLVGTICFASSQIMLKALNSSNGMAGAVAVCALAVLGIGAAYLMMRTFRQE